MFRFTAGVVALSLLSMPAIVRAEDEKPRSEVREPKDQKEFLAHAIACEQGAAEFARKAVNKASSEEVKNFAKDMKTAHEKNLQTLLETTRRLKIAATATTLDKADQEECDRIMKLEGRDFDRAFMKHVAKGHEKGMKTYKTWADSDKIEDEQLKKELKSFVTTYEKHKGEVGKIKIGE